MHTMSHLRAVVVALVLGCSAGCGGPGPSTALSGEAVRQKCAAKQVATRCFHVTVTNLGATAASAECWVAAIHNYRSELGRSDTVSFTNLAPGEVVGGDVTLSLARGDFAKSPIGLPVHCEPGGSG